MELIKHVGVEVEQVQLEPKYFEKLSFGQLNEQ